MFFKLIDLTWWSNISESQDLHIPIQLKLYFHLIDIVIINQYCKQYAIVASFKGSLFMQI